MPAVSVIDSAGYLSSSAYVSTFLKQEELVTPGFYQVKLHPSGVNVELTAGERVGMHRYVYPSDKKAQVVVDLENSAQSLMLRGYNIFGASTDKRLYCGRRTIF